MANEELTLKLAAAWGNYLPVKLNQEEVRMVSLAVNAMDRLEASLAYKKQRLEEAHWDAENDASDDRLMDINQEITILYREIEVLEYALNP